MDVLWHKLKEVSLLSEISTISRSFLESLELAAPAEYYKKHEITHTNDEKQDVTKENTCLEGSSPINFTLIISVSFWF
jgi:hypothetical protein